MRIPPIPQWSYPLQEISCCVLSPEELADRFVSDAYLDYKDEIVKLKDSERERFLEKALVLFLNDEGIPIQRLEELPQWFNLAPTNEEIWKEISSFDVLENRRSSYLIFKLINSTYRLICRLIDTGIQFTGIEEILNDRKGEAQSYHYVIIQSIISFFFSNVQLITGSFSLAIAAIPVAFAANIALLTVYKNYFRPVRTLPSFINLTREEPPSILKDFDPDETLLETMIHRLNGEKGNNSLALIGPSGAGKTLHVKVLAERIQQKKCLQGKEIIYINASQLLSETFDMFGELEHHLGADKSKVILFIDEVQSVWEQPSKKAFHGLNSLMDQYSVIVATTKDQYDQGVEKSPADFVPFIRRTVPLTVLEPSEEQMVLTLFRTVKRQYPYLEVSVETVQSFLEEIKKNAPKTALLAEALSELSKKLNEIVLPQAASSQEIKAIDEARLAKAQFLNAPQEASRKRYTDLRDTASSLTTAREKTNRERDRFLRLLKRRHAVKTYLTKKATFGALHEQFLPKIDKEIQKCAEEAFKGVDNPFISLKTKPLEPPQSE